MGGPFDEGLRKFSIYLEAVLDYVDKKVTNGNPDKPKSA